MEPIHSHLAGLDVHKTNLVACLITPGADGKPCQQMRTFGTTTGQLLALSDWLATNQITLVGMESTGVYWKPIFNMLEANFTVWLLNAQHVKNVPGRKTDVQDAAWLAELLCHGLLRPSFVPPPAQRALRELTRERINFVRQRATLINRYQKVLEATNLKLGDVVSDVMGRSARDMMRALLAGETDSAKLAALARGTLRNKQPQLKAALRGQIQPQQRFILREILGQIDNLEQLIKRFDEQIEAQIGSDEQLLELLDTIPGVGRETAELLLAEIGTDMSRFPTAGHLAAWAGLAPGQNESAGRRRRGKLREGNKWLRAGLVQAAWGAVHTKGSYLGAQYARLARRSGSKRAIVAVAHSMLVSAYYIIKRGEGYKELGSEYFKQQTSAGQVARLRAQLAKLGYEVIAKTAVTSEVSVS